MIVVTAPTGNIGSQLVPALVQAGERVRVIARDPGQLAASVNDKVEVVQGSHSDRRTLETALDGANRLFWLVPSNSPAPSAQAAYVDFARPAAALLAQSDVRHVVSISALGRGWPSDAGHVSATLRMDDMLAATGVEYAALACGSLMENIARQTASIRDEGVLYYPSPSTLKLPYVATRDVAALSARLLLDTSWSGVREIPMMGPDDLSYDEIVAILSEVLSKPVRFQEIGIEDMKALVASQGATPGMAQAVADMLTAKNDGLDHLVQRTTTDVANAPTTFRQWAEIVLRPAIEA